MDAMLGIGHAVSLIVVLNPLPLDVRTAGLGQFCEESKPVKPSTRCTCDLYGCEVCVARA
eukprot:3794216-Alexandrium_andersonii.AAC.1